MTYLAKEHLSHKHLQKLADLFLKSLRRYSRSMPTPSLMLSQEKSCRRCSKQTGNPKTSKDGKFSSRVRKT